MLRGYLNSHNLRWWIMPLCSALITIGEMTLAHASSSVVINEVMANEPGSAVTAEWVELHNLTDATIWLDDYIFIDGDDTTRLEGLAIAGAGFIVLARRPTGENSFESLWGDGSGTWGDAETEDYVVFPATMSLRNTGDTVLLVDDGVTVSIFMWSSAGDDGVSWERTSPGAPDSLVSFAQCRDQAGSTPGGINSWLPKSNDLAILADQISMEPGQPRDGDRVSFTIILQNVGRDVSTPATLEVVLDDALVGGAVIPALAVDESYEIIWSSTFLAGVYNLHFSIVSDGNSANNYASLRFKVSYAFPEIVINEFMPDPVGGSSEEWVELYHREHHTIDLAGWRIGDSLSQRVIIDHDFDLEPGEYLIVCEHMESFLAVHPEVPKESVIEVDGWRALNNDGDRIVLLDEFGSPVDSVTYLETFDGARSIERVRSDQPAANPDNWWGSVAEAGATPGEQNSVAVEFSDRLAVSIAPNPFRQGEEVTVESTVAFQTELTVTVYDVNGRKCRTLLENQPAASGSFVWNGTDDHGRQLPPGMYVMLIETQHGEIKKIPIAVKPE